MLLVARQNAPARDAWLGEFRATLALAWPMVLTNLAQIALTTTDVIVVGRLGASALAAATLGVNLYFGLLIFAIGLVSATSPMMAEVIGRNHRVVREVRRTFRQGLWSAVIVSVPAWALLWHTEAVLLALGQEPQLAADAHLFMRELQWGFLPALGFIALRSFVAALERPVWAMLVTGIAILFNIAANWALVFGHLGLPALGLRGSGLATTLSNTFLFLGLVVVVLADRQFRRFRLFGRWWRPDWPRLATLWRLGVPIGATMALEVTLFNAAVFLMGQFGAVAIAAHSIAIQIAAASFMVPLGIGQAATVRVGIAHGAGLRDDVTRAGWAAFQTTEHPDEAWSLIAHLSTPESNAEWAKRVGVIPIHEGADQDPAFRTPQYAGWFEELNNAAYVPTIMPTYLEQFGYFADSIALETSQQALLGEITAQEMADQWAAFLTDEYAKWKAAK